MRLLIRKIGNQVAITYNSISVSTEFEFINDQLDPADLKWYIEEFPVLPLGANLQRANKIEDLIIKTGKKLFTSLFSIDHQENLKQILSDLSNLVIEIDSVDTAFSLLPWEFLYHDNVGFIIPNCSGLYRNVTGHQIINDNTTLASVPTFRILLIISRPKNSPAIPVRIVVSSILNTILKGNRTGISVELLRPPTFENLKKKLSSATHYDLIHFDGHGALINSNINGVDHYEGYLEFEDELLAPVYVSGADLLESLQDQSPIVILNACNSAFEAGNGYITSVAGKLSSVKGISVIAMQFAVYGSTVRNFMAAFYNSLLSGTPILKAISQSQQYLYNRKLENKSFTHDWLVPKAFLSNPDIIIKVEDIPSDIIVKLPPYTNNEFFARDSELLRFDRIISSDEISAIYLTGIIGEGKTYFIKSFAKWFHLTGGSNHVKYYDFNHLNFTSGQIETNIETNTLIILDHIEAWAKSSDFTDSITNLHKNINAKKSKLVLVGRIPLSTQLTEIFFEFNLGDLPNELVSNEIIRRTDTAEFAMKFKEDDIFTIIELIDWHAQALTDFFASPDHDLAKLSNDYLNSFSGPIDTSASRTCKLIFDSLSQESKKYLPLLGLFSKRFSPAVLRIFTNGGLMVNTFEKIYGKTIDLEDWSEVLKEFNDAGLARENFGIVFEIPPVVRQLLRKELFIQVGGLVHINELKGAIVRLYSGTGSVWLKQFETEKDDISILLATEEANIELSIWYGIELEKWDEIYSIINLWYLTINQSDYSSGLIRKLNNFISAIGNRDWDLPKRLNLKIKLETIKANIFKENESFVESEKIYLRLLALVEHDQERDTLAEKATLLYDYFHFCCDKNDFQSAEVQLAAFRKLLVKLPEKKNSLLEMEAKLDYHLFRFQESYNKYLLNLENAKESGNKISIGVGYHQLGIVCEKQGKFKEAKDWFLKALRHRELYKLLADQNSDKFQLGSIAEKTGQFVEAKSLYEDCFRSSVKNGEKRLAAFAAYHLGMVHEQLNDFDGAVKWLDYANIFYKKMGLILSIGNVYHELGIININRNELQQARIDISNAIEQYTLANSIEHVAGSIMNLALCNIVEEKFDEARNNLYDAILKFNEIKYYSKTIPCWINLCGLELKAKNYTEAINDFYEGFLLYINNKPLYVDYMLYMLDEIVSKINENDFLSIWNSILNNKMIHLTIGDLKKEIKVP